MVRRYVQYLYITIVIVFIFFRTTITIKSSSIRIYTKSTIIFSRDQEWQKSKWGGGRCLAQTMVLYRVVLVVGSPWLRAVHTTQNTLTIYNYSCYIVCSLIVRSTHNTRSTLPRRPCSPHSIVSAERVVRRTASRRPHGNLTLFHWNIWNGQWSSVVILTS